ncbi:sugar ABC transporter permease [Kribbella aluminosa]
MLAFILVPLLVEATWVLWPAIQGFYLSTLKWDGITSPEFVGSSNYRAMIHDPVFQTAFKNTIIWLVLFGGLSILGGLGMAMLLQRDRRGVSFYRSVLFLPVVLSMTAGALVWGVFLQPDGPANQVLKLLGLGSFQHFWLADPKVALYSMTLPALWRQIGYLMVLFIAGLKAIDPQLYEAARIDGASRWQEFRHITIPQLRSVNGVVIAVTIIDALRSFDVVWALTRGGPYHSTELLSTYMYSEAFQSRQLGYASALAVVIFLLASAVIVTHLVRAFREDSD